MSEYWRHLVISRQGLWYGRYEQGERLRHKRISPVSYRQGHEMGFTLGVTLTCVTWFMLACVATGWLGLTFSPTAQSKCLPNLQAWATPAPPAGESG